MFTKHTIDYSVYLVTEKYDGKNEATFLNKLEAALKGGVTLVQLREKNLPTREFYKLALKVKTLTAAYNVPFIVNDRLDIALAVDADGLHIGQKDLPADVARRVLGNDKILGVSTETVEQAQEAAASGADYLGVGAVFHTTTKADATSITMEDLHLIHQAVSLPIVAIGGITLDNVSQINRADIAGVAVVSAILSAAQPQEAAKQFLDYFQKQTF